MDLGVRRWLVVGVLAVSTAPGCGLDQASDGGGTDSEGSVHDTDETASPEGADETDGPSDTAAGGTGTGPADPSGDSGGTTGWDDFGCEMLSCGGAGFCDVGDDGPVCVCDEGWISIGLDCIRCEQTTDGMLPATVPTLQAHFAFTVAGETPPESLYHYGTLTLRNRTTGDIVALGDTSDREVDVLMLPGAYDVIYDHRQGTDLPANRGAVLERVEIDASDSKVEIDVPNASLRGAIHFADGDTPDSPLYDYGRLWLVQPSTGGRVALGDTRDDVYDVHLTPGRYEIRYETREHAGATPLNNDGFLGLVDVAQGSNAHDIVIETVSVTGDILVDGAAVDDLYDRGTLELRDVATGDVIALASTDAGSYAARLVPGDYEVVYTSVEPGPLTPRNVNTVVGTLDASAGTDTSFTIDIRTGIVSGGFRLDGAPAPVDPYDDGRIVLEGERGGSVALGMTSSGDYTVRVVRGTYGIYYGQDTAGASMPVNTHARLGTLRVQGDTPHDVDIPVVEVLGNLTLGGLEAPDSPYDDGRLYLGDPESGDKALLGNTRVGMYAARVVPGTYRVIYDNELSDEFLPVNRGAILMEGVDVSGGAGLDIDVPVTRLWGTLDIVGETPATDEGTGYLFLREVLGGGEVFLGHTGAVDFNKPLTTGTYLMEYRGVARTGASLGGSLPANENAAFACFDVTAGG